MESWIEVIDGYKVSEVYSTKTNKILKKHTDRYGYLYVGVYIDGRLKFKKVHRLVAKASLSNYSDDLQINHKNEDKRDNRVENPVQSSYTRNLRWKLCQRMGFHKRN